MIINARSSGPSWSCKFSNLSLIWWIVNARLNVVQSHFRQDDFFKREYPTSRYVQGSVICIKQCYNLLVCCWQVCGRIRALRYVVSYGRVCWHSDFCYVAALVAMILAPDPRATYFVHDTTLMHSVFAPTIQFGHLKIGLAKIRQSVIKWSTLLPIAVADCVTSSATSFLRSNNCEQLVS